jgi:phosphate transport system substrate-binding protein
MPVLSTKNQALGHMNRLFATLVLILVATSYSCDEEAPDKDNQTSGSITISIDENYKPVMDEQLKVFRARNPQAVIKESYKSEAECVNDFINDSTRLIFMGRAFTESEKQQCLAKHFSLTRELPMARDAVAFVVAKGSKSEYTQLQFENLLMGKGEDRQLVFDREGSSTYTYLVDSVLKGRPLTKNIFGAKGGEDLLSYISKNSNSIGAIGVSWVSDPNDANAINFLKNVDVVGILPFGDSIVRYRKPHYAYIGNKEYPYRRDFYFASKEDWVGLGTGFVNYLCKDGQLLFSKSNLFPLQQNVLLREVRVTN